MSGKDEKESGGRPNPFADAILSFVEDIKDNTDRKSLFYKEVVHAACALKLADESQAQSHTSASQLSSFIADLEVQHRKKSGTRRILDLAQPLIEGLLQYTDAVDVMIQAGPAVTALIYGGAKLVLQLANGYTRYFEQIIQMMADIGLQLQYFHIYTTEFASDKGMHSVLYNSYKDILEFWRDASKVLNQRGKRFLAGGLLAPFHERYGKFKAKLDKNAQNVRHMAQALHVHGQGIFNKKHECQVLGIAQVLREERSANVLASSESKQSVMKHDAIRRWISGGRVSRLDSQSDLNRHAASRHAGTCQWIFQDPQYLQWSESSDSASIWVNAAPGAGKSVLSACVVEKLKAAAITQHTNVIYFFCRFDDPEKCEALSALRAISLQALKLIKHVPDELYEYYQDECVGNDCYISDISVAENVAAYLFKRIDYVSIILDGIDECRQSILLSESLIRLAGQKRFGITKWLLTSRNEPQIRKKFTDNSWDIMDVPKRLIQKDIRTFLDDNTDLLCQSCDQLGLLAELSQGNFLMMRLAIDPFRNEEVTCSDELDQTLLDFQPELARCWLRSLQRLLQRSAQVQDLAKTIFNAVILAIQPMTFNELLDLLSVDVKSGPSSGRRRKQATVLSACSPFVEVDYESDFVNPTLRLAHKSFGDLLTQDPATLDFVTKDCYKFFVRHRQGHADLGRRCLSYLSCSDCAEISHLDLDKVNPEHGLLKYAAIFWYQHLAAAEPSEELFGLVRDFLKSPNSWSCVRVQGQCAPHIFAKLSYHSRGDGFLMHAPGRSIKVEDEYYSDALPPWVGRYDIHADDIVWGYHMFVREWGQVIVDYPAGIQQYFGQVLGPRSFWSFKPNTDSGVEIITSDTGVVKRPSLKTEVAAMGTSQELTSPYVRDVLSEAQTAWIYSDEVTLVESGITATAIKYVKLEDSHIESDEDDAGVSDTDEGHDETVQQTSTSCSCLLFLSVSDGHHNPYWIHHVTALRSTGRHLAVFLTGLPWLLWPKDEDSVIAFNWKSWDTATLTLPVTVSKYMSVAIQDFHYSTDSRILYRASILTSASDNFTIRHTSFPLETPLSDMEPPQFAACTSQDAIWRSQEPTTSLPVKFTWHLDALYAALGKSSIKILRFPSATHMAAQTPSSRQFIPSSSYSRALQFQVESAVNVSEASSIVCVEACQAVFRLSANPALELPAVCLKFRLEASDWEEYDPLSDPDKVSISSDFLKGKYAAKDQSFSVPIRSGLDWRRSVFVTCW